MSDSLAIILTGATVAAACGVVGAFLVLRRLAMLGDAISHAVLPGIVIAFLITQSRGSIPMLVGAGAVGILTAVLVQLLEQKGVQGDAAIGVTFTSLFALGVVLISRYAGKVDLDLDCVLHGDIAYVQLDPWMVGDREMGPRALWVGAGLLLANCAVITLFFKQFKLCAFDPALAASVGIPVSFFHYLLMGMVSVTTVGSFESVGAILVVAMLIVPGATAYLLTDRLSTLLVLAGLAGVVSAVGGYYLAVWLDGSIAGGIGTVSGCLFVLALFFSPRQGLLSRAVQRRRMKGVIEEEDLLLWAGRRKESPALAPQFSLSDLETALGWMAATAGAASSRLVRAGSLENVAGGFRLTPEGARRALELLRRHRIYESYLGDLGYPADHTHAPADRAEHFLSPQLAEEVNRQAGHPHTDPQGRPIPAVDYSE